MSIFEMYSFECYHGYFHSSDLYFEYTLCTQLTSSDETRTDGELCQDHETLPSNLPTLRVPVEKYLQKKKSSNHAHLVYEAMIPPSKPLVKKDDDSSAGQKPSIKLSPCLSKIEEEGSTISSSPSVHSDDTSHFVTLELPPIVSTSPPVKFSHQRLSPALSKIEEEDETCLSSSASPSESNSMSYSPTTVNQGVMQALMDQKIEHASKDFNGSTTPPCDVNSDLSSVSLDPAIWSDSEGEMNGGVGGAASGLREHSSSNQRSKQREKDITPAMRAVGSVCFCVLFSDFKC